ncbi:MAG TPA: alpha/beta fold hydrolase [Pyrinomonadaceae bacterium]|nr:alpha/beta fold hydrolase [Pyrinomonadaceae bacterium]
MKKLSPFLLFTFCFLLFLSANAQNLTVREMMREPSIAGMRPDSERLSPDGKFVIYAWNADGKEPRNLYIVNSDGSNPRILVNAEENYEKREERPESKLNYGLTVRDDFVKAREKNLGGVDISPDSTKILFSQNTDIYVLDIVTPNAKPRRITRTQGFEGAARWLTNDSILYNSGGNYFVLNLKETSIIQVTKESNPQAFVSVFNVNPTKDAKLVAYVVSDGSRQRALFTPNYLDEFVQTPSSRRGFSDQKVLVSKLDGSLEKPFELKLPKAEGVGYIRGLDWAADNQSLIVDRIDKDLKRRQLFYVYNVGSKAEQTILVTEETDEKWVAGLSRIIEPNPKDASQLFFASERDGFNHLYLATLEKANKQPNPNGEIRQENPTDAGFTSNVKIEQTTQGKFEIDWAKWTADASKIIFSSTEENTAEREFFSYSFAKKQRERIFSGDKGIKNSAQMDEVNSQPILLYEYSTWKNPSEIYTVKVCPDCRGLSVPTQLTKSTPESFLKRTWSEPKFVDIPTRDGKIVKAKAYFPADFNKVKDKPSFPMVMFIHGAGYLQNTINGWNNYYREFMFNQMLTQKGYVVLDIDYRGSAGYGRDWRTDVHDFLGGKDYEDHLDAIDFAVKNYSVDAKRVGVYGGSYGGFMAGMLITRAPDKVAAAAALRPVFDWKNYFASSPIYTLERLGFPEKNPEAYKRSSPIFYADKLEKPMLILHGLVDDNVPAQDSIQMIEKLIRLEKTPYFEAMLYPSENHGFVRATSWTDEYERIFNFFEKHLKN